MSIEYVPRKKVASLDRRTSGNGQSITILRNLFPKLIISIDENASLILMSIHMQFRKLLFFCYVFLFL